jgi:hypothetical protein
MRTFVWFGIPNGKKQRIKGENFKMNTKSQRALIAICLIAIMSLFPTNLSINKVYASDTGFVPASASFQGTSGSGVFAAPLAMNPADNSTVMTNVTSTVTQNSTVTTTVTSSSTANSTVPANVTSSSTEDTTATEYVVVFDVDPSGAGSTDPSDSLSSSAGSSISISATANSGYEFSGWSVSDPSSITIDDPSSASTSATINGVGTITANFSPTTAELADTETFVLCDPGAVEVGGSTTCTVTVTGGSSTEGQTVSWGSAGSGMFDSTECTLDETGACSVTYAPLEVGDGGHTITANYAGDATHNPSTGNFTLAVTEGTTTVTTPTTTVASSGNATIWTDKADYAPGDTPTIYGSGFQPNAGITVSVTRPEGTVNAWLVSSDDSGSFTTSYATDTLVDGTFTVTATDGTNTATTTFTDASFGLAPSSGPVGTSVTATITGNGGGSGTGSIYWDGSALSPAVLITCKNGAASFTVPLSSSAGSHTVTAYGCSGVPSASFSVTTPSLTLTPDNGLSGTVTTLSGASYAPGYTYYYCYESGTVATACLNTNPSRSTFTAVAGGIRAGEIPLHTTLTITGSPGPYVVVVSDSVSSTVDAHQAFTVNPLTAYVNFATTGLPTNTPVSVTWSGTDPSNNPITDPTNFNSPGPSSPSIGTQPGTSFTFSFPATIGTYYLVDTSQSSPFNTGISGSTTTVTATYVHVAQVNFATTGLPSGASVTVSWTKTNAQGHSASGSTTFNSPGPSANEGTQPGTTFTYSFPASITVSSITYNYVSASPASGFTTGAGGTTTTVTATYQLADTTPPTISCTVPDQTVWYGSDVTVQCTASDSGSGLANPSDASFDLSTSVSAGTETASAQTTSHQVCDNAGNCATAGPYTFKVDKKAPEVSCTPPDNTIWYGDNVNVPCTATDGGSGVAPPADESFSLSTNVPADTETDSALTDFRTVCDAVNNCAPQSGPFTFKVDKKKPSLGACPVAGPFILNSGLHSVGPITAYDYGSGLDPGASTLTGTVDTSSVGTKSITFTAVDNVENSQSNVCTYVVKYNFIGFFQPVDNPPVVNIGRAGRTIPIKFQLTDAQGNLITSMTPLPVTMRVLEVACTTFTSDPVDPYVIPDTSGSTSLRYDPMANQWIFNWQTAKGMAGKCYQIVVLQNDPGGTMSNIILATAYFALKPA